MAENKSSRQQAYKTCAKSSQEMRTRRHDVTVELRKNKREDQMLKRRNIDVEDMTSPLKENNCQSPQSNMTLEEIFEGMQCNDDAKVFIAIQSARKMLSRERNPPIDIMVAHGIVPLCTTYLDRFDNPDLQFEAAWALTNVASGTSDQTMTVVQAGAIPKFVKLLGSSSCIVAEQAVWALGNIAGDGPVTRDFVLNHNAIEGLMLLITSDIPISFLRNIVWLMSNLCRNKNPPPPFEKVKIMLPVLSELLKHQDAPVLTDACWAISYVTDDDNTKIQSVIDAGCVPHLVNLLSLDAAAVIVPALRSVGNIVTGSDSQTDAVIAAGGLPRMARLLQHAKPSIVKEAAWTVSNVTAGNAEQVQKVLDTDIFALICEVLEKGDFKSQKEAAWVVTNTTTSGTPEQIVYLIDKFGILKPFCDLLAAKDARTVKVVLTGISNLFSLAEKMGSTESLSALIEENGALDKLEALQTHENEEVYKLAYQLIDTYFLADEVENKNLAPTESNGALEFNSNDNAPSGGFTF